MLEIIFLEKNEFYIYFFVELTFAVIQTALRCFSHHAPLSSLCAPTIQHSENKGQ